MLILGTHPPKKHNMKTALFTNFSNKTFTGYWDGKPRKFEPGESLYMPDYLAEHFAKHLTNRELLAIGQENSMSPKKPEDHPHFMKFFNQAYTPDKEQTTEEPKKDTLDVQIEVANRNRNKEGDPEVEEPVPAPVTAPVTSATDNATGTSEPVASPPSQEESFDEKPLDNQPNK